MSDDQKNKILEQVKIFQTNKNGNQDPKQFNESIRALALDMFKAGSKNSGSSNLDLAEIFKKNSPHVKDNFNQISSDYEAAFSNYQKAKDADSRYIKLKFRESFLALIFRAATTAVVGIVIMCLYAYASKNGIPLPFLRGASPSSWIGIQ